MSGSRNPSQVLPGPEHPLLDRVARELGVPEDEAGGRVQAREAPTDEHAEGLMIALARPSMRPLWSTVSLVADAVHAAFNSNDSRQVANRSRRMDGPLPGRIQRSRPLTTPGG